ncbi:hypothetical protein [Peribacillus simplex]|uniref:hypothetical protein n=1 Tax=Peribacillus simplex TaxID=1478 RepID=UPI00366ACDF8
MNVYKWRMVKNEQVQDIKNPATGEGVDQVYLVVRSISRSCFSVMVDYRKLRFMKDEHL